MENLNFNKVAIYAFCLSLLSVGSLTVGLRLKPIARTTFSVVQTVWEENGDTLEVVSAAKNSMEASIVENIFAKETYIDWYGLAERLLGRRYIRDTNPSYIIVKDQLEQLHFITFKTDSTKKVEQIAKVKEQLLEKDIPFLFAQTPIKVIENFTKLPDSVRDYANSNTDAFLEALGEKGVDYIDLRKEAETDELDKENLFYTTDHHWRTQTAFWAMQKVVDKLAKDYDLCLDDEGFYTNLNHYEMTTYENSFLGSQGRRVGRYYAGVDDYTLITPKFETKYEVTIYKSDGARAYEGDFTQAIVHKDLLDIKKTVYTNRYAAYFGADYPEVVIKNEWVENNKKILIIKDSFALPFSAFLSTMTEEIHMLDLRYYDENKLGDYIEDYNPDLVLYVYKSVTTQ